MDVFISDLPDGVSPSALKAFLAAEKCFLLPGKPKAIARVSVEKGQELLENTPVLFEGQKLRIDRDAGARQRTVILSSPSLSSEDHVKALLEKHSVSEASISRSGDEWHCTYRKKTSAHGALAALSECSVNAVLGSLAAQPKTRKAGRLIVRNLSFDTSQKHLEKTFGKIGSLREVHMPKKDKCGFAFIEFEKVDHAAQAITDLNGKKLCGRDILVEYALQKTVFEERKLTQDAKKTEKAPFKRPREETDDEEGKMETNVDEEVKRMKLLLDASEGVGGCDDKAKEAITDEELPMKKKKKKRRKDENDDGDASKEEVEEKKRKDENDDANVSKEEKPREKKRRKDEEASKEDQECGRDLAEGKTVFIRNIPYDATWKDVKQAFEKYGKVDRVYLCKPNSDSKGDVSTHKGTGFIKFKEETSQQSALAEEANIKEKMRQLGFKDQNAPLEGFGVMVKGRRVIVLPATKPEECPARKDAKKADRKAQKESWGHLLNMGSIDEVKHPQAWATLSKAEKRLREASKKERKFQVNNPNFTVNPLRLSIRNIELKIDGPAIMKALKSEGIRAKKVTVVRSKDRKDASGTRRSLGYAFADFEVHEDALNTLKFLNNNAKPLGGIKRPLVEFAMEDKRKLRKIELFRNIVEKRKQEEKTSEEYTTKPDLTEGKKKKRKPRETTEHKSKPRETTEHKPTEKLPMKKEKSKTITPGVGGRGRRQREKKRAKKLEKETQERTTMKVKKDNLKKAKKNREPPKEWEIAHASKPKKEKRRKDHLEDDFEAKAMNKWR